MQRETKRDLQKSPTRETPTKETYRRGGVVVIVESLYVERDQTRPTKESYKRETYKRDAHGLMVQVCDSYPVRRPCAHTDHPTPRHVHMHKLIVT